MTNPVTSTGASAATPTPTTAATTAATSAASSLGQDAFLKLLVAQLSHQDPTQPVQGTEFVTQLSQFSLVEQSVAQSTTLSTISNQIASLGSSQATDLIGKQVTVNGSAITYNGLSATQASATLGAPAANVTATISDSQGNAVRTLSLGSAPAGLLSVSWDGKSDQGVVQPTGSYTASVSATDANGNPVSVSQNATGVVTSVSYAQGYPAITLNNGTVAAVSNLVSVSPAPSAP